MAITYKDISQLTQKSSVTGTEKLPVSDTEYITPSQITGDCVHTSGTETVAGAKTFSSALSVNSSNSGWSATVINGNNAMAALAYYTGIVASFSSKLTGTSTVLSVKTGQTTIGSGGTTVFDLDASGNAVFNGTLTQKGNVPVRKITISSSEPTSSDGDNGDIWIVI